jgi:hypothetical protein
MRLLTSKASLLGVGLLVALATARSGSSANAALVPSELPPSAAPSSPIAPFFCPPATVQVTNGAELAGALANPHPGDVIWLRDGVYDGNFTSTGRGTPQAPISLCGGPGAVLQSDGYKGGYVLHFDHAADWRVAGFTVRSGQKGVMVDAGTRIALQGLLVEDVGDEAVHLRANSTDNVVRGLTVRNTGNRREEFGEGIYIGTAKSNWGSVTDGLPDRSDRNFVLDNTISATTAESIDVKEGTSGGVLAGNSFDGTGMSSADSWVDVKGSGWLITGNRGHVSPKDGFQTHVILPGWGEANLFTGNLADLGGGPGVGFYLHKQLTNRVSCTNISPGTPLSNLPCTD